MQSELTDGSLQEVAYLAHQLIGLSLQGCSCILVRGIHPFSENKNYICQSYSSCTFHNLVELKPGS